jgi:iron complex outermembrane receptor protein
MPVVYLCCAAIALNGQVPSNPIALEQQSSPTHSENARTNATGRITGAIMDPSGAVIAGARVELRSTATNFREVRISDHLGHFSFVTVPAGDYQLTVTASGFADQILHSLTVAAGAELPENLSLNIEVAVASVMVEGLDVSSIAASGLTPQANDSSQSHNSADMLADVPGVSLHDNGELATIPFLHGLGDERAKIVVDGMTVSSACPNHMNPTLSYVAPAQAAKLTVLAGITPVSLR